MMADERCRLTVAFERLVDSRWKLVHLRLALIPGAIHAWQQGIIIHQNCTCVSRCKQHSSVVLVRNNQDRCIESGRHTCAAAHRHGIEFCCHPYNCHANASSRRLYTICLDPAIACGAFACGVVCLTQQPGNPSSRSLDVHEYAAWIGRTFRWGVRTASK